MYIQRTHKYKIIFCNIYTIYFYRLKYTIEENECCISGRRVHERYIEHCYKIEILLYTHKKKWVVVVVWWKKFALGASIEINRDGALRYKNIRMCDAASTSMCLQRLTMRVIINCITCIYQAKHRAGCVGGAM